MRAPSGSPFLTPHTRKNAPGNTGLQSCSVLEVFRGEIGPDVDVRVVDGLDPVPLGLERALDIQSAGDPHPEPIFAISRMLSLGIIRLPHLRLAEKPTDNNGPRLVTQ